MTGGEQNFPPCLLQEAGMEKQEKARARIEKKMQKKKEKQRRKRWKKINHGLDLCLILSCFLAFLTAAVSQMIREKKEGKRA